MEKETIQKPKQGKLIRKETKQCVICGKEFLKYQSCQITCSKECSLENRKRRQYELYHSDIEFARKSRRISSKKIRHANPSVRCLICGEIIYRAPDEDWKHSKPRMHDECIYKDCVATLKAGERLSQRQYLRIQSRGWTLKEFKEEFLCSE